MRQMVVGGHSLVAAQSPLSDTEWLPCQYSGNKGSEIKRIKEGGWILYNKQAEDKAAGSGRTSFVLSETGLLADGRFGICG